GPQPLRFPTAVRGNCRTLPMAASETARAGLSDSGARMPGLAGGHHAGVAAGKVFAKDRRPIASSRLPAQLSEPLPASAQLDSDLPDGRLFAPEPGRLADRIAEGGLWLRLRCSLFTFLKVCSSLTTRLNQKFIAASL